MGFPLELAVQRLKICKNKTRFDAMKGKLIFLALLSRFGVRGIGTPELLVLLVTKEHLSCHSAKTSPLLVTKEHPPVC